jgi:hypothetical protein
MNKIASAALVSLGAIYGAYVVNFYPAAVTCAALGFLAYAVFSRPSTRRPTSRVYWGE